MTRKSKKQRDAEQAVRQRLVREAAREKRRPTREDIDWMFFWKVIPTGTATARVAVR
nr:hypothetical protein RNT25_01017 [arsenite-oxidising bacterium NT-25]